MSVIAFIGLVIAVSIIVTVIINAQDKKRTKDLEPVAKELGFTFSGTADLSIIQKTKHFKLLNQGSYQVFRNIMQKQSKDQTISLFDYKFDKRSGKSTVSYNQSVVLFENSTLKFPGFVLTPEKLFDKFTDIFSKKDIDFSDSPVFSKQYLLKGDDEEAVRKFFNAEIRQYFTTNPGYHIETSPHGLIIYKQFHLLSPKDPGSMIAKWLEVYQLLSRA